MADDPAPRPLVSHALATRVRRDLRWRDVDMLGHLNQSVYHELLEEGRGAMFERMAPLGDFSFVLARVELDYRSEVLREHGHVEVVVRPVAVGRSSVTVENDVLLPDGTVAASGRSVMVAWDAAARRSRPLTERERETLGA